jgi:hypothetical protein
MGESTLQDIYDEMITLSANKGDCEVSHERADELLCEALLLISSGGQTDVNLVKDIVGIFNNLTKWYA